MCIAVRRHSKSAKLTSADAGRQQPGVHPRDAVEVLVEHLGDAAALGILDVIERSLCVAGAGPPP